MQSASVFLFHHYYFFLGILWFFLCLCLLLNLRNFYRLFREEQTGRLFLLLLILAAGAAFRIWLTPYIHHVYNDEYGHFLKAIAWSTPIKEAQVTRHMPGWSFLMSLAFSVFGAKVSVGFSLSAVISTLSIPLVYCFIRGFSVNRDAPLWGALITACLPLHIRYSASMDTDQVSFSFLCLALAACSLYKREPRGFTFPFLLVSAVWCVYIRQENILFLLIVLFGTAWVHIRPGRAGKTKGVEAGDPIRVKEPHPPYPGKAGLITGFFLTLVALLPFTFQNLVSLQKTIYGQYFMDQGVSASMAGRVLLNLGYFFRNTSHPIFFTILVLAGAAGLVFKKGERYLAAVSAVWLIGYFAVYLFIEGHFK